MDRRRFTRELNVHENVLRKWVIEMTGWAISRRDCLGIGARPSETGLQDCRYTFPTRRRVGQDVCVRAVANCSI